MGSPINRQFHLDNQGSALDLTTATGSIEAAYHTDAWGNVISGTAADNPYIYLGGLGYWQEGALNLNYVRARWQEVSTGSWLSVDSVRTQPRYQYASNSPTRLVDPSGMDAASDARYYSAGNTPLYRRLQAGMPGITQQDPSLYQMARRFYDQLRQNGARLNESAPTILSNLFPEQLAFDVNLPYFGRTVFVNPVPELDPYNWWWMWGVACGLAEGVFWMSPLGTAIFYGSAIGTTIAAMVRHPSWGALGIVFSNMWKGISGLFTSRQKDITPFQKGRILGNLIVMVISLLEAFLNLGSAALKLGGRIAALLKSTPAEAGAAGAEAGVVAGRGIAATGGGEGQPSIAGSLGTAGHSAMEAEKTANLAADLANHKINELAHDNGGMLEEGDGGAVVYKTHLHHIYPKQFRPFFEALGIDIDNKANLTRLEARYHQSGVHGKGGMPFPDGTEVTPGYYNAKWKVFIDNLEIQRLTRDEMRAAVEAFADKMEKEYGLR